MTSFSAIMGGFTGYYTHIGDGGEHDFYEGETPVERAGYVTDLLSDRAAAWVADAAARPEPYFLSLHYTAPHWPWSAPSVEAAARRARGRCAPRSPRAATPASTAR